MLFRSVVVNGLGAAGTACCQILLAAGVSHLVGCGRRGIVLSGDPDRLRTCRHDLAPCLHQDRPTGTLQDALKGADVFIGLSVGNVLRPEDLDLMAPDRIVFAMANPDPEISPELGAPRARVFATGRSDYTNQINNVLAFPGIFRGALDVRAPKITEEMKMAASHGIASVVSDEELRADYIIPSVFNSDFCPAVSRAVAEEAQREGMA